MGILDKKKIFDLMQQTPRAFKQIDPSLEPQYALQEQVSKIGSQAPSMTNEGYPANASQLYSGPHKEGGFWESKGGQVLQGILPLLAGSGVGALLGALASPSGYRGLGAGRGAAIGAQTGIIADIGQRQKSAEAGQEAKKTQQTFDLERMKLGKEPTQADILKYKFYESQTKASGGTPKSFDEWLLSHEVAGAGGDQDPIEMLNKILNFGESKGFIKKRPGELQGGALNHSPSPATQPGTPATLPPFNPKNVKLFITQ